MLFFFVVIAAALVVATIIGGDVRRLSHVRIRHIELLIGAFAAKACVAVLGATDSMVAASIVRPLNLVGTALLLIAVWFNRRIPGALIFGAGLISNLTAIVFFGGRMPILLPSGFVPTPGGSLPMLRAGTEPLHVLLSHPQGLWFLGDIFLIPGIVGRASLVSIGDILMAAGVAYLIVRSSLRTEQAPMVARPTSSPAK